MKSLHNRFVTVDQRQVGVSLAIVLIFLVILSGLAITAMRGSSFAARIAGNEADRALAFQAAEAALKDAEYDIRSMAWNTVTGTVTDCIPVSTPTCRVDPIHLGDGFDVTCPLGRCVRASPPPTTPPPPVWEVASNWSSSSSVVYGTYTGAPNLPVVAQQPRYMLEYFKQGEYAVYRVTALGFGANASTQAIVQSAIKGKL